MHHFATPLRPAQQNTSRRNRSHGDGTASPDGLPDDANEEDVPPAPLYGRWEKEQRRVAGLSAADDDAFQVPDPPFPHAPPREPRPRFTAARIQQELAASSGSKSTPAQTATPALRSTHLNVLSTVMHRCLLEGDYQRAARAWGLILRTQAHGTSIEPRYNGLWGLGAELLLCRKSTDPVLGENEQDHGDENLYSEEGFQSAKDYYERLILQYPVRNFQPLAIDATTFYPPLFSVWIMQVLERSRRSRRRLRHEARRQPGNSMSSDVDNAMTSKKKRKREAAIQREELAGAREICRRLEELVQSPPYDKNAQLLILRGHAGLWISDLLLDKRVILEPDDESDYSSDSDQETDEVETPSKSLNRSESLEQVIEAKAFFEQALRLHQAASRTSTSNLDKELRDVGKRIADLQRPR